MYKGDIEKERQMFDEFRAIYKEYYKEDIDNKLARELGQNLLNVYRIVYRQPPKMGGICVKKGQLVSKP